MKPNPVDPLYVIFEQHLFNFQDPEIDRKTLVLKIVADYLEFLRKRNVTVPRSLEQPIVEELATQVNTMLVRKIYGCVNHQEFQRLLPAPHKRRARSRYGKLVGSKPKSPAKLREKA